MMVTLPDLCSLTMCLLLLASSNTAHEPQTFDDVVKVNVDQVEQVEANGAFQHQDGHDHGARSFHDHARDKDHILKDMEGVVNKPEAEMTQEELQFHYFKLHDNNNDNLLDGWELMHALNHEDSKTDEAKSLTDVQISDMLDPIFKEDDRDQDGFISYAEFMASIK